MDLHIRAPFGAIISVKTDAGKISLEGFPTQFTGVTETGEIDLTCPWEATKFLLFGAAEPKRLVLPKGYKVRSERSDVIPGLSWIIEDKMDEEAVTYGRVRFRAERSKAVRLHNMPIPPDSPIKMTWLAEPIVKELIRSSRQPAKRAPTTKKRNVEVLAHASNLSGSSEADGAPLFRSDVRMVNLSAAVYDAGGRPLVGLKQDDFTVVEDGQKQEIDSARSEEAPFNLAILLDLSASTKHSREEMKQIAEGFVKVARPQDKIAVYALFNNWFGVLSHLSEDREAALAQIDDIPDLTGSTPLYDAIVLAWNEDLAKHKGERNAMIVITDGQDNRFASTGFPSKTSEGELAEAAKSMDTLIYPIFLGGPVDSYDKNSVGMKAYQKLREIAAASGGRVFEAGLADDRENLYQRVADDLRSVYSISYYPDNQDFDGGFRTVQILVDRLGAKVRTRDGYYAR
ncbi:MAG: VWA domain-containing protein [Acidobacteria bacterium]|nr:VWA domain-containing protein [Acidobacteriota bacterium]